MGKMCSIRTKGKREERISLSSSTSRSRRFTPLLFTLCAVPLNKFGSVRQKIKGLYPTQNFQSFFWSTYILSTSLCTKYLCFLKGLWSNYFSVLRSLCNLETFGLKRCVGSTVYTILKNKILLHGNLKGERWQSNKTQFNQGSFLNLLTFVTSFSTAGAAQGITPGYQYVCYAVYVW